MHAPYPRLLVARFADCFRFYAAVLPPLTGADLDKGGPEGPYANWEVDGRGVLVLFDRAAMASVLGTGDLPDRQEPFQDTGMLVLRVDDVDEALALCLGSGGAPVLGAADRPEWGPGLRTAHLRDPEGRLLELQSYS
ncbi:extradiol dioxygenase [Streptomyces litmocidini]|uniref:glyoxalase/bleomycin resistance/extradiol dioxygenase family protein n=1 Tax=Streptomyces litmocidini TaxID=67318 RepID=UPI00167D3B16|nr:glyoxalase/bleomycin resistance/extradiol dioxygenase family protein [Streptomyces litmocidini]GGU90581.1 extradiol dioxygenase [Streptomyces litmocidini]